MNYPNQKDNPARQALPRAVDRALATGAPVYVNQPAKAPGTLAARVRRALTSLNNVYGYGDVRSVVVYMDGRIEFQVQGYMMAVKMRRGHLHGCTVHALRHQKQI